MKDLTLLSDDDLFYSAGSSRPKRGGLRDLINPGKSDSQLALEQAEFDAACAEMRRRDFMRGFPFRIPS